MGHGGGFPSVAYYWPWQRHQRHNRLFVPLRLHVRSSTLPNLLLYAHGSLASLLPWVPFLGPILLRSSQCVSAQRQSPCRRHLTGCSTLPLRGPSHPVSPISLTKPISSSAPSTSAHSSTFSSCFRRRPDARLKRSKRSSRKAIRSQPGGWIAASAGRHSNKSWSSGTILHEPPILIHVLR